MVLIDSSVWVDYLRGGDETVAQLLTHGQVCMHQMVIGELACGNLQNRAELINFWQDLPELLAVAHQEALFLLESRHLMGTGIGYIDLHLLAACLLSGDSMLWTHDKRLANAAQSLGLAFTTH